MIGTEFVNTRTAIGLGKTARSLGYFRTAVEFAVNLPEAQDQVHFLNEITKDRVRAGHSADYTLDLAEGAAKSCLNANYGYHPSAHFYALCDLGLTQAETKRPPVAFGLSLKTLAPENPEYFNQMRLLTESQARAGLLSDAWNGILEAERQLSFADSKKRASAARYIDSALGFVAAGYLQRGQFWNYEFAMSKISTVFGLGMAYMRVAETPVLRPEDKTETLKKALDCLELPSFTPKTKNPQKSYFIKGKVTIASLLADTDPDFILDNIKRTQDPDVRSSMVRMLAEKGLYGAVERIDPNLLKSPDIMKVRALNLAREGSTDQALALLGTIPESKQTIYPYPAVAEEQIARGEDPVKTLEIAEDLSRGNSLIYPQIAVAWARDCRFQRAEALVAGIDPVLTDGLGQSIRNNTYTDIAKIYVGNDYLEGVKRIMDETSDPEGSIKIYSALGLRHAEEGYPEDRIFRLPDEVRRQLSQHPDEYVRQAINIFGVIPTDNSSVMAKIEPLYL